MPLHEIELLQSRNKGQQHVKSHFSTDSFLTASFWNMVNTIIGWGRNCNK